ncbi:hypothetical protein ColTof4_01354 [Colletotrichum tofieldiae]|nr:serine/arginine repetitive matrix protein 1-like [Colletotrichum tofieldiae]GKT68931.1 hypothetical protein ColTof4_01354 [Colletotrichum tofieldiae]GKT96791.1 serine/arginine repetitive matrix protein 1-like [Colletotrichum tofieldiae]
MCPTNDEETVCGLSPLRFKGAKGIRFEFGAGCIRAMYQHLVRYALQRSNIRSAHWKDLERAIPAFEREVKHRVVRSLEAKLHELERLGAVRLAEQDDGAPVLVYEDWTRAWLKPDWDGSAANRTMQSSMKLLGRPGPGQSRASDDDEPRGEKSPAPPGPRTPCTSPRPGDRCLPPTPEAPATAPSRPPSRHNHLHSPAAALSSPLSLPLHPRHPPQPQQPRWIRPALAYNSPIQSRRIRSLWSDLEEGREMSSSSPAELPRARLQHESPESIPNRRRRRDAAADGEAADEDENEDEMMEHLTRITTSVPSMT